MAKSRHHTPFLKDEDQLQKMVKQHIKDDLDPSKHQLLWQGRSDEGVLENYQDFLTAVAQLGRYLDKTMLFKVVRKQFEGENSLLKEFTDVMARVLKDTKRKSKQIRSGARTSKALLRLSRAWLKSSGDSKQSSSSQLVAESSDASDASASSEVEMHVLPQDESEADEASKALALAKAMFPSAGPSSSRGLKREHSVISVASEASTEAVACTEVVEKESSSKAKVLYNCPLQGTYLREHTT